MKIKDVHIDGFGVWSGLTIHGLPDTMTVFYGPNEAGKTTVMQFLRAVFYGFTPERRRKYLPPVYGGKPGGIIRVQGPGGTYEIVRRANLDAENTAGNLSVIDSDGMQHGHHRLSMLLGQMDEGVFSNVFAIGLRELQELSTLDDTAAADELYKLSSGIDRVSLVDVLRQLRSARQELLSRDGNRGILQRLQHRRQELKKEQEELCVSGRRWIDLASQQSTYVAELKKLKQDIEEAERGARSFEIAIQTHPIWVERRGLAESLERLGANLNIPDDLQDRLDKLNQESDDLHRKLEEVTQQRKRLRERARGIPLRPGILQLAPKIEAANEHEPWLLAMQKNIARLRKQIEETQLEIIEEAARLGVSEEDQQALLEDRRGANFPDLSRQSLHQLMEPAAEVRTWTTRLKHAQQQAEAERQEAQRLKAEIDSAMESREVRDIHRAIEAETTLINNLRKRIQIEESLEKLRARQDQMEEEAIDLQCDEALPVERSFLMGILFVAGAFLFMWGLGKLLPFFNPEGVTDTQTGLLFVISGMFMLFFGFVWSNMLDRTTVSELSEVEEKLEAIRKEIRKLESERDDLERRLPAYQGTAESRLQEAELEVKELESLLPVWHNFRAAVERERSAKKRAAKAEEALRSAQLKWRHALAQLGLSDSLSPKSVRLLAEGYENLMAMRRRLHSLEEELETRCSELRSIALRIESLANEAFDDRAEQAQEDAAKTSRDKPPQSENSTAEDESNQSDEDQVATRALRQLARLNALINSQRQAIAQRKRLRDEDRQLARTVEAVQRSLRKLERRKEKLLAAFDCETEQELRDLIEKKRRHLQIEQEIADRTEQMRAIIGDRAPWDTVLELLERYDAERLSRKLEALQREILQAEERIELLNQRRGETNQEMKDLAADKRLSEIKLELDCVEQKIEACRQQWQTLATTSWLLDRVCETYVAERQPETLREASRFLKQLTDGKYVRIWTPLGKNQLMVDNAEGQSLAVDVLSRGTREAVFIGLRLSLAAAYARRGIQIPLVLDDVLVNFDAHRVEAAARVLRDFAALGHQVFMFTCHDHIMKLFYDIGVQVRVLPPQGEPGEADVYQPRDHHLENLQRTLEKMEEDVAAMVAEQFTPPSDADQPMVNNQESDGSNEKDSSAESTGEQATPAVEAAGADDDGQPAEAPVEESEPTETASEISAQQASNDSVAPEPIEPAEASATQVSLRIHAATAPPAENFSEDKTDGEEPNIDWFWFEPQPRRAAQR